MNTNLNKKVIINVIGFIVVFISFFLWFFNLQFTGDAAGKGMAAGFTFLYGLAALLVIAIIISIINFRKVKGTTAIFIKLITLIPLALVILAFLFI